MKLNERSLAYYATCDSPADRAGFLYKKGDRHGIYRCLWFVLKGNLLFYFEEEASREPAGVIVLEGCTVELCDSSEEFTFAIRFQGGGPRAYVLAADSQTDMEAWVKTLSRANFDYMRLVVRELEQELERVQRGSAMQRRSQRRAAISRRRPVSTPAGAHRTSGLRSGPGSPAKEDDESAEKASVSTKTLPNCYRDLSSTSSGWEYSTTGSAQPPPLPPRRRMTVPGGNGMGGVLQSLESPVCPGTACFSKLHEWYGKEIEELRRAWNESQAAVKE